MKFEQPLGRPVGTNQENGVRQGFTPGVWEDMKDKDGNPHPKLINDLYEEYDEKAMK